MTTDIICAIIIGSGCALVAILVASYYSEHRNVRWMWDWSVTFGIAIHRNLLPEFIWIWQQRTPPPWKRRKES